MATDVTLPQLGESVTEGTVTRWLKQVGDSVAVDEPLLEVSTDKVDTEIPSPVAGTLLEIKADEDETVEVGAVLAVVGDSEESSGSGDEGGSDDSGAEEDDAGGEQQDDSAGEQSEEAPAQEEPQEQDDQPSDEGGSEAEAAGQESSSEPAPTGESTQDSQPTEQPATDAPAPQGDATPASGGGTEVALPQLGESVTEGTVTRWLKQVGDSVEVDEPLLEVSTDKVDTEIPSPVAGTLLEIRADEDETVEVGAVLAIVGDSSDSAGSGDSGGPDEGSQAAESTDAADESGADQTESEPLAQPESEPEAEAPEEDAAPESEAQEPAAEPEAKEAAPEPESQKQAAPAQQSAPQPTASGSGGHASSSSSGDSPSYVTPLVRKLAAQHDVDLTGLEGTGVGGRIRKQDVLDAAEAQKAPAAEHAPAEAAPAAAAASTVSAAPSASPSPLRGKTEPLSRLRKVIAKRMVESLQVSAQLTTVVEVDVTAIARRRAAVKDDFAAREGVKLSFMPFFAKAAIDALKQHPSLNAAIDTEKGEVTYFDRENLAIAVDTEKGLLTPVLKEAGDLSIAGLARKIADIAERTRTNKITPDELSGGTFTLTNTGSRGALFDTPIINQPQVAILGTGSIVKRPVVIDDPNLGETIAVRSMVYLALTYDHRLVDGADAARYLSEVKQRLEAGQFDI